MKNEFEISGLVLKYPSSSEPVLSSLDLKIEKGTFNILLGQNGSGKSSLMKCLAGIENWNSGEVLRQGVSRTRDFPEFNKGLLFISEDIQLPSFSIRKLTKIYEEIWGSFDSDFFRQILSVASIKDSNFPTQLSRGQRALVQFALAISAGIDTLLIDEITAVLDPFVRSRVVDDLVKYCRNRGATVVVATNIASEFVGLEARIVLLANGRIYLEGPLSEISKEFAKVEIVASDHLSNMVEITSFGGSRKAIGRRSELPRDIKVIDDPITLEEIFIYLSALRRK